MTLTQRGVFFRLSTKSTTLNERYLSSRFSIAIPLGIGAIAGGMTSNSPMIYESFVKLVFSPSAIAFPIVWTILFTLMGISIYLIFQTDALEEQKDNAYHVYALQLLFNFSWSIIFFNLQIPYLIWVTFAGYLNYTICYLN